MVLDVYGTSDIGRVRSLNEDSFCIYGFEQGETDGFCVLSDGMGGHNAGEVASQKTVQFMAEILMETDAQGEATPAKIGRAVHRANQKIYQMAGENQTQKGMGATSVLAVIEKDEAYIANVGDSRAYAARNHEIMQITKDHSVVEEMVANGCLTREEAKNHPQRNMITRAIGTDPMVEADVFEYDFLPGDCLLLCSDGLSGMLEDTEILSILEQDADAKQTVTALIDAANERGGRDNITAICIRFAQEG